MMNFEVLLFPADVGYLKYLLWCRLGNTCFVLSSYLQVKLYKSENLDNPIHTVNLGLSLFFHFPPLLRDGEVRILLEN